jgi:EmrB/QacA subfamily drug resistance transporter
MNAHFQLPETDARCMCPGMEKPPSVVLTRRDIGLILAGLLLAMMLGALDQTIVSTAMPTIGRDLGSADQIAWIVSAYLLTAAVVTPLYGKLSDIHGRRIILLIAIAIFLIGSLLCALSRNLLFLVIARAIQGAGGGGLISLGQTIIGDILPPRERARYQIYIASVFILSSIAGPVLGGFLAEHLHWTAIFWLNLPLGLAAFLLANEQLKRIPRHERPHKLDVIGAILLAAATSSLVLGLNWGGTRYAWLSPEIFAIFAVCLMAWAAFAWRLHHADEPLIPLALFSNRTALGATLAAGCSLGAFVGPSAFTPIFFEGVLGLSATQSGGALLPLMVGTVIGATIASRSMIRLRHYKIVPLSGLAVSLAATTFLVIHPTGLPLALICTLQGVVSIGLGMVFSVATLAIQNAVMPHQLGTALATSNLVRQLGAALAVAICGSIIAGTGIGATGFQHFDPHSLSPDNLAALVEAYRHIFIVTAIATCGALLALTLVEELPMLGAADRKDLSEHRPAE